MAGVVERKVQGMVLYYYCLLFDVDFVVVLTGTTTQAITFTVVIAVVGKAVPVGFMYP